MAGILDGSVAYNREIAEIGEVYRAQTRVGRELGRDLTDTESALIALSLKECFQARAIEKNRIGISQHG